jgi:hypothetical protein
MDQSLTLISDAKNPMSIAALHVAPFTITTHGAMSNSLMATPTRTPEPQVLSMALKRAMNAKKQEALIVGAQETLKGTAF